eukprot:11209432-Lingulodinium_polyedra.AAC.1
MACASPRRTLLGEILVVCDADSDVAANGPGTGARLGLDMAEPMLHTVVLPLLFVAALLPECINCERELRDPSMSR